MRLRNLTAAFQGARVSREILLTLVDTASDRLRFLYCWRAGPITRTSAASPASRKTDAVTQCAIGFSDDGVSRFASSAMRWGRIL
jgi:hypothetical protein